MNNYYFDRLFTTQLSDVGCTTRLISKNSLKKISPRFTVNGNHFGLEMMLLVIKENIKFVEIPLKYNKRVGASSVTGNFFKTFMLGITMIAFSFKMRFMKFYRRES